MTANIKGILLSYLIATPVGLLTILFVFITPVALTGEGIMTMGMLAIYGKATIGLIVSFLVALGIGGHNAVKDLENKRSLIKTSYRYSLTVNTIIWTTFILLTIFDNKNDFLIFLLPPIIAFIICTTITTFTIGLLVCYTINKRTTRAN